MQCGCVIGEYNGDGLGGKGRGRGRGRSFRGRGRGGAYGGGGYYGVYAESDATLAQVRGKFVLPYPSFI